MFVMVFHLCINLFNKYIYIGQTFTNQLLVGKSLTDVDVFIKQIDAQMKNHHEHKFFTLLEEVFVSNDPDLKAYIKKTQFIEVNWIYKRFIDLFGQEKKPY